MTGYIIRRTDQGFDRLCVEPVDRRDRTGPATVYVERWTGDGAVLMPLVRVDG